MSATLHVFGAGGHGREIAWLAREVLGPEADIVFVVDDERYLSAPIDGHPVVLLSSVARNGTYVVAVGDVELRKRGAQACEDVGLSAATLVHPRVELSTSVTIGEGSVVCAGSVLTTGITIGHHVHINVGCTVSHDVVLEDFATLSPGVHLAGRVHVGAGALLGIGATVINGAPGGHLSIGAGATVAAGSCVIGDVAPGVLVAGVPAVRKR